MTEEDLSDPDFLTDYEGFDYSRGMKLGDGTYANDEINKNRAASYKGKADPFDLKKPLSASSKDDGPDNPMYDLNSEYEKIYPHLFPKEEFPGEVEITPDDDEL